MPLRRHVVSVSARRTIQEAFTDLEKAVSPSDAATFSKTTLQDVQKAANEVESQLAARQSLRNMRRLVPLFTGLDHYSRSIEILCNSTAYLAWVWAPITLVLKLCFDYVDAFDKIIKAYCRIAECLARFEFLNSACHSNHEYQETSAVFYADILKFHKESYKFLSRNSWKLFFSTSWGRFQRRFDNIIEDLQQHGSLVDKIANAINISESRQMREDLRAWREDSLSRVSKEEEESSAKQYLTITSDWLKLDDSDQTMLIDSITSESAKYPGAGAWFTRHQDISSWMKSIMESFARPMLILKGHPGTGKSVLAAQIVHFLEKTDHSLVVRHFCSQSVPATVQYDQILRSILRQLLRPDPYMISHVYEDYVLAKKTASVPVLEQLILSLAQTVSPPQSTKSNHSRCIHVVLDGLDECEEEKQSRLITILERLACSSASSPSSAVCKVLICSRNSAIVARRFRRKPTVSLSDDLEKKNLEDSIKSYASQKLNAFRSRFFQMGFGHAEMTQLEETIAKRADGMFLWARLVLQYLTTNMLVSRDEIQHAVNTLPRELGEFYKRILTQSLSNFDKRSVERMKTILGWIAYSKRPLRKSEFQSALAFATGGSAVIETVPSYMFEMCGPLIEERRDSTFAFIHVSVKRYLESPESCLAMSESAAITELGFAVAACLVSAWTIFDPGCPDLDRDIRLIRGLYGFYLYANEFWVDHLLSIGAFNPDFANNRELREMLATLNQRVIYPGTIVVDGVDNELPDGRIRCLDQFSHLRQCAINILRARRSRRDENLTIETQDDTGNMVPLTGFKDLLSNYQTAVRLLLQGREVPGASFEELQRFKAQFKSSAYTCRLHGCPRATLGFETDHLRVQHEQGHARIFPCTFPDCQYPPQTSAAALRRHISKYHADLDRPLRIRKPKISSEGQPKAEKREPHHDRGTIHSQDYNYPMPLMSPTMWEKIIPEHSGQVNDTVEAWDPPISFGSGNPVLAPTVPATQDSRYRYTGQLNSRRDLQWHEAEYYPAPVHGSNATPKMYGSYSMTPSERDPLPLEVSSTNSFTPVDVPYPNGTTFRKPVLRPNPPRLPLLPHLNPNPELEGSWGLPDDA